MTSRERWLAQWDEHVLQNELHLQSCMLEVDGYDAQIKGLEALRLSSFRQAILIRDMQIVSEEAFTRQLENEIREVKRRLENEQG